VRKYSPDPVVSVTDWKRVLANPLHGLSDYPLSQRSWMIWGAYYDDPTGATGWSSFPTATDCLLWIRWHAIPAAMTESYFGHDRPGDLTLEGPLADLAGTLDSYQKRADAAWILDRHRDSISTLCRENRQFWFSGPYPVHEYLTHQGTPGQFAELLKARVKVCWDGKWKMSRASWARLSEMRWDNCNGDQCFELGEESKLGEVEDLWDVTAQRG
jgi:hypothetical protein